MLLPTVIHSLIYSPYCPHYILLESMNSALHFFIEHGILHTVALQQINNLKKKNGDFFFFLLTRVEVHSRKKWEVSGQPWSTENKERAGKALRSQVTTLHSLGSWCSAPCVHQGPWMTQATGRSRTVHMTGSSMSPGHPPQRWSRWGWVDGE